MQSRKRRCHAKYGMIEPRDEAARDAPKPSKVCRSPQGQGTTQALAEKAGRCHIFVQHAPQLCVQSMLCSAWQDRPLTLRRAPLAAKRIRAGAYNLQRSGFLQAPVGSCNYYLVTTWSFKPVAAVAHAGNPGWRHSSDITIRSAGKPICLF